jgi:iron complex outermembrane recepter protein
MAPRTHLRAAFSALLALLTTNAFSADGLDEVIVTAQKREQSAQDVPIAIAALSGNELEHLDLQSSADITRVVPGVNIAGSYGGQLLSFSVRGVTQYDFSLHTEAPIAVYVDEAYLASQQMQNFGMFDVDQVEVLKGPQGTLFGHNATGGAIVIRTRQPTNSVDGYARLTYGRFDQVKFEGAYGGPINDVLSARVSLYSDKYGPYTKNIYPGDGESNDDTQAGRIQVRYHPSDTVAFNLSAFASRSTFGTSPYNSIPTINICNGSGQVVNSALASPTETRQAIGPNGVNTSCGAGPPLTRPVPGSDFTGFRVPGDPRFTEDKDFSSENFGHSTIAGTTGKLTWKLGGVTLTSISDYKTNNVRYGLEFDESPTPIFDSETLSHMEQISEDLRLDGATARSHWVVGTYYLYVNEHTPIAGFLLPALNLELRDTYRQHLNSAALYGQMDFDLTDRLTVTAGARASNEDKKYHYEDNLFARSSVFQDPWSAPLLSNARLYDSKSNETLWGGRAELSYRAADHFMVYGGYNRGTKGGGFNAPLGGSASIPNSAIAYRPEELNAYEAGFKSEFFDGAARLNAAGFYYDYHDYQGYKAIGTAEQVQNYDAIARGAEAELEIRPIRGLNVAASAAYIDMTVKDVNFLGIIADRQNVKTPPVTASVLLRYQWPFAGGTMALQTDGKYTDRQYYCICDFSSSKIPAYGVGNARVEYMTANDRIELYAYVNNFTDKIYKTIGFDFSGITGSSLVVYGAPRWWGIGVKYNIQ